MLCRGIFMPESFWWRNSFIHMGQITEDGIHVIFQNLGNVPYAHLKNPGTFSKSPCSDVLAVSWVNELLSASPPSEVKWASWTSQGSNANKSLLSQWHLLQSASLWCSFSYSVLQERLCGMQMFPYLMCISCWNLLTILLLTLSNTKQHSTLLTLTLTLCAMIINFCCQRNP